MARLEVAKAPPPVNRRQIDEDARIVSEQMSRLVCNAAEKGDPLMALEDRLATMSVAEHVAWSVALVPGFQVTMAGIHELMDQHAQARSRLAA